MFSPLKIAFFGTENVIYCPIIKFNDKISLLKQNSYFFRQKIAIFMKKRNA
jgi:hypothetical protein